MNENRKSAVFALLVASLSLPVAPRVLAVPLSAVQTCEKKTAETKDAAAWREIEEKRARKEIATIYDAMAAAQQRGDLNATKKFFAPDIQIVTDSGARIGFKDLQRVLALPAPAMKIESAQNTITGFARRSSYADAKVSAKIVATSRKKGAVKSQHLIVETLRREVWRRDKSGWRLVFSKTLAQITRAK